jgi:hypothetical protein
MIVHPLRYVTHLCTGNMLPRVTRRNSADGIGAKPLDERASADSHRPTAPREASARDFTQRARLNLMVRRGGLARRLRRSLSAPPLPRRADASQCVSNDRRQARYQDALAGRGRGAGSAARHDGQCAPVITAFEPRRVVGVPRRPHLAHDARRRRRLDRATPKPSFYRGSMCRPRELTSFLP